MEANNSYCGVGIAFNARIGGEENNVALSRQWEAVYCGCAAVAKTDIAFSQNCWAYIPFYKVDNTFIFTTFCSAPKHLFTFVVLGREINY